MTYSGAMMKQIDDAVILAELRNKSEDDLLFIVHQIITRPGDFTVSDINELALINIEIQRRVKEQYGLLGSGGTA